MPPKTRAKALNYHAIQLDPAGKAATYDNWAAVLASGPLGGGLKLQTRELGRMGCKSRTLCAPNARTEVATVKLAFHSHRARF